MSVAAASRLRILIASSPHMDLEVEAIERLPAISSRINKCLFSLLGQTKQPTRNLNRPDKARIQFGRYQQMCTQYATLVVDTKRFEEEHCRPTEYKHELKVHIDVRLAIIFLGATAIVATGTSVNMCHMAGGKGERKAIPLAYVRLAVNRANLPFATKVPLIKAKVLTKRT